MTREEAAAMPIPGQAGRTGRLVTFDYPPELPPGTPAPQVVVVDNRWNGIVLVREFDGVERFFSGSVGWTRNADAASVFGSNDEATNVLIGLPLRMQTGARVERRDFSARVVSL